MAICEFCYTGNLHKTVWQREWCAGCSCWVETLCPVLYITPVETFKNPKNLKTYI